MAFAFTAHVGLSKKLRASFRSLTKRETSHPPEPGVSAMRYRKERHNRALVPLKDDVSQTLRNAASSAGVGRFGTSHNPHNDGAETVGRGRRHLGKRSALVTEGSNRGYPCRNNLDLHR